MSIDNKSHFYSDSGAISSYIIHRYKMAGQWFALPKLFKASKNEGYEIVRSDDEVIQFKNEQVSIPFSK